MTAICSALDISQTMAAFLSNSELLASLIVLPLAGRLGTIYKATLIETIGLLFAGVFGLLFLIPGLNNTFMGALCAKLLFGAAIGTASPMGLGVSAWLCSADSYPRSVMVLGVLVPLGVILGSFCTSLVTASSWYWVNVAIGICAICGSAACWVLYPKSQIKKARIDLAPGAYFVYATGITATVFGLLEMSSLSGALVWVSLVAALAGVGLLVAFYYLDQRSMAPFVPNELKTASYVVSLVRIFCGALLEGGSRYFFAAQLVEQFAMSWASAGACSALSALGIIIGVLLTGLRGKTARGKVGGWWIRGCGVAQGAVSALIGLETVLFPSAWVRVLLYAVLTAAGMAVFSAVQIYATQGIPSRAVLKAGPGFQLAQQLGAALGVPLAVLLRRYGVAHLSYGAFFWLGSGLCLVAAALPQPAIEKAF